MKNLYFSYNTLFRKAVKLLCTLLYNYLLFEILGNAALQQFVEIKQENTDENKDAIENVALKKAKVYKKSL